MTKFTVVVLPKSAAARAVAQLQPPARKQFWLKINELCADPIAASERASYFAPLEGQVFRFKLQFEGWALYCIVVFKFADSSDENTLLVSDVIMREI